MEEEYWVKCGFKENGELTCVRILFNSKPDETFYYTEEDKCTDVKNPCVIRLTKEVIEKIHNSNSEEGKK